MFQKNPKGLVLLTAILALTVAGVLYFGRKDPSLKHRRESDLSLRFGHGVWIVNLRSTEDGNLKRMVKRAQKHSLTHVLIKTGSGDHWYRGNRKRDVLRAIQAFHAGGIRVFGWNYIYGRQPNAEVLMAKEVLATDVDGLVFDVEAEFSRVPEKDKRANAEIIMSQTRKFRDLNFPGKILGYSTFCRIDEPRVKWRWKIPPRHLRNLHGLRHAAGVLEGLAGLVPGTNVTRNEPTVGQDGARLG